MKTGIRGGLFDSETNIVKNRGYNFEQNIFSVPKVSNGYGGAFISKDKLYLFPTYYNDNSQECNLTDLSIRDGDKGLFYELCYQIYCKSIENDDTQIGRYHSRPISNGGGSFFKLNLVTKVLSSIANNVNQYSCALSDNKNNIYDIWVSAKDIAIEKIDINSQVRTQVFKSTNSSYGYYNMISACFVGDDIYIFTPHSEYQCIYVYKYNIINNTFSLVQKTDVRATCSSMFSYSSTFPYYRTLYEKKTNKIILYGTQNSLIFDLNDNCFKGFSLVNRVPLNFVNSEDSLYCIYSNDGEVSKISR